MKDNPFKLDVVSVRLKKDFTLFSDTPIKSPEDATKVASDLLEDMDREVIMVFNLMSSGEPINCQIAGVGTLNACVTHPRDLMKASILSNASNMIMVHNHPSGDTKPSMDDIELTDRMTKVCNLLGIYLLDHIIISGGGREKYFSMLENGILQKGGSGEVMVRSEYLDGKMVAERSLGYGTDIYDRGNRDSKVR